MQPLSTLPLLVGRTLAHCNLVEDAPLRFHPDMGVARKHGARDLPAMIISSPAPEMLSTAEPVDPNDANLTATLPGALLQLGSTVAPVAPT